MELAIQLKKVLTSQPVRPYEKSRNYADSHQQITVKKFRDRNEEVAETWGSYGRKEQRKKNQKKKNPASQHEVMCNELGQVRLSRLSAHEKGEENAKLAVGAEKSEFSPQLNPLNKYPNSIV